MMVHSSDAVPYLAALLDSSDTAVQSRAVRGLSLFVNEVSSLTPERARAMAYLGESDSTRYVDPAIAPYVAAATPVPEDRLQEFVFAWRQWWTRIRPEFAGNHPDSVQ